MNVFYNDNTTDLKLRCDNCMNSRNSGVPKVLSRLMAVLHVTTPQPLQITPALQEASLWAPPLAVNINFCGYL